MVFMECGQDTVGFCLDRIRDSEILLVQNHSLFILHDCAGSYSGRCNWDWYFSLASRAIKQVLASNPAPPFSFNFPQLTHPKIQDTITGMYLHTTLQTQKECRYVNVCPVNMMLHVIKRRMKVLTTSNVAHF